MRLPFSEKTDGSASFLRAARAGNLEKVLEFLKTNTDINTCNPNGLNALHLASKEGHVNVVRELLQRGANVDAATKKGNTALHIASLAGQEEIVKVLVLHQALVNIQSQNGFTPLYMAAQENHDSVVRFLLANNANQSLATEDGFTPLAVALQQGHDKVVAVLLENDTRGKVRLPALHIAAKKDDTKAAALLLHTDHNPDVTSKSGFTPLHIAAHYGNENIANLLIQRGADVNYIAKHQITPLHVASKWGKGNMVSLLIDKGANYEAKTRDGLTPLHCAARSGHETVVDMLLEKGAPITSKTKNGLAPLHMASQGDHVDAARILLYHKAPVDDVTVDFLTALHVAAHCGHVRVAKLLLDRKADPNSRALNGFTPLHIACKKNRIKVVELLLKHGASIEATTESGLTPLHVASFMGCMNIVIYLIQHGASADVPTVRGETPLHLAARANQTDIIRILLRNGAQVDARAREQQTALHIASRLGNSDIVVLLLQHGAAVDATTKDHYTALHIAAKEGQEEVASVLLEHGASLTSTTKKGFTPLHLAAKYGNLKVARLLLQKDAPVDAQGKNGVTPLHVAAHYDHQNVAMLLLDKGASPHATAKNGYTPLHIAARKNQMDIATTLLEYEAKANAESKAGFTPLHLSSQEGHTDMATLLIEHKAPPGACAKNGLTPLHLCAQEDRVNVAAILVKHRAQIDPETRAGYTPLHVACHFGQMNMVRLLLKHGAKVDSTTQLGYTPLHQAAQQGHTQIVNLLLENKAEPNTETNDGKTALSIAQRLGYISVVETLKIVTETTINTTTTTVTEEKYKVVVPETMHETFMSESEDEGGDDTMLGDQSYRYLTVDEMKSLGDDSLPIDVTKDEKMDVSFISNSMAAPPVAPADQLSPQHQKEHHYPQFTGHYPSDNVDVAKTPILAGPESLNTTLNTTVDSAMIESQIEPQIIQTKLAPQLSAQMNQEQVQLTPVQQIPVQNNSDQVTSGQFASVTEKSAEILNGWEGFLVSFMVDARGGAMRGCRHSGVRVIIPPRKAAMPMRVTCRYLKKDKLVHAPPLMEGEALASRILEMGPAGAKFLGPVIIEVPHFASLRGKEREIVILRSDNGETWREHTLEATEEAVQEVLNESFDGEELKQLEDLNTNRITRILTTDFPQYFAIVTRIRQEVHAIGPEGGMVSSTVVPQVQAVFPQGALTKKIKVGLQAQPIPTDLVAKLLGNRVAVSPIVTVEPRRRKFHKPITLTIPVPQASSKGMINQYSGEAPTLRLLCSITGGTTRAQWEDVTGSTPLTFVNDCVSFTTTVSARFWLMDCSNIPEATKMATELYREAIHVPFMAKFVVFSKRHQLEEARVRVFCMTDDREDKTLEHQELFVEVAKSRDVEVLEGKPQFLEFAGNLVPVTKSGDQLAFNFYAFRENRLPFTVRVKDQHADPIGRVAFMRQPKVGRGDPPQTPICNLNIALPDNIQPEPAPSEPDLLALEKKYSFLSISKADTIHKADLRLTDISNMLGTDWVALAHELEINDSDINIIKSQYPDNAPQQAIVMLRLWMQTSGNKANGNTLEKGLRKISRDDIVNQCIFNVELVTDDIERAMAKAHLDQSGFEAFKDELGPSRDATLNRDVSLDVSYDEQDMMKEAESAEEEEENQRAYQDKSSREQRTVDMSPTYESEEKKYAGEEKIVTEEKVTREDVKDGSTITISTTSTTVIKQPSEDIKLEKEVEEPVLEPKVEAIIKEQIIPEPIKETKVEPSLAESVVSEPIQETIITTEEVISHVEPQKKMVFTVTEAEEEEIEKDEQVVEQKELEKPVVKVVEKPAEVIEKIEEVKMEPETFEEIHAPEVEETQKTQKTTTVTEIISGPAEAPTTVTTTQKETYTTSDDGTIQEHIVVQKQTTKAVDGLEMGEDKSVILQKLGEELGRLDEKLEEKFREKRKTDEPEVAQEEVKEEVVAAIRREGQAQPTSQIVVEYGTLPSTLSVTTTTTTTTTSSITPTPDGFTQTSVESSQMSSKRGTAEVSYPGTTTTIDDDAVMQMGQALIQQTAPQLVDKRIVQEDPLQEEVSQQYQTVQEQPLDKTAAEPDASAKSGRTEERGCSPITVLEARPEVDQVTVRPLSRGSSHTITTTTSWGAPVSTTTNIQLGDNESAHCVQFTLHSESRVTLHAPGEIWDELRHVKQGQEEQQRQQQPEQQDSTQKESRGEVDNKDDITTLASITTTPKEQTDKDISQEDTSQKHLKSRDDDEKVEELQAPVSDASGGRDITSSVTDSQAAAAYHDIVGVVTSAESISEFRHKTPDPSKTVSDDVIESTRDTLHDQFTSSNQIDSVKERLTSSEFRVQTVEEVSERVSQSPETAEVVEATAKENVSKEDTLSSEETIDKAIISVLPETVVEEIAQSLVGDITSTECEHPAAISEDPLYVASEITAPSAHRPTTLMITSNSNESTDDAECTTNDPSKIGRENDIPRDLSQEGSSMVAVEESKQQGMGTEQCSVMSERLSGSEGGAVPRTERPVRPAPRTTTLVKVKVEKRPVGSHPQVRERIAHEHQTVVRAPSVEEEVRGLMQEVKEATSQIKQEVKELRQADTPTPDTPTPLREFKEFLNREEEQEQERLPTIKEMCRESEEDASVNTGGEHPHANTSFHLELNVPIQECSIPLQVDQPGVDGTHPDSGYSTLEGHSAVSVDPSQATKYTPFFSEIVPEGSSDEHSVKSELESPSSPVDNNVLCPVDSIGSAISQDSKESRSKLKLFLNKVRKLTSRGLHKSESRKVDGQGEDLSDRDSEISSIASCETESRETSGLIRFKDEGLKSSSYEYTSAVQPAAVKKENTKYYEKHEPRIGEQLRDKISLNPFEEFYVDSVKEIVDSPVKDKQISEMGEPSSLEMPHTEDSHTKSPVSEFPLTEVPNTESPVTELSYAKSPVSELPQIESPVSELPSIESPVSELPSIESPGSELPSTDSLVSELPHTESSVSEFPSTGSPVSELPSTDSLVSELPHTESPVPELPSTDSPVSELPHIESPVSELPHTESPVSELPHIESPVSELPHIESPVSELPHSESPVSELPHSESPVSELPHSESPVSELPHSESPVSELPYTESPVPELPITKPPVSELPHIESPVSELPHTESPVPELPSTKPPVSKLPHIESPVSKLPHSESPVSELPHSESPVPELPSTKPPVLELSHTEVTYTESTVSELPHTEVPYTESTVSELPHTEVPYTESTVSDLPHTEVLYTESTVSDLPHTEVLYTESSELKSLRSSIMLTDSVVSGVSAITPFDRKSQFTITHDPEIQSTFEYFKVRKVEGKGMFTGDADDGSVKAGDIPVELSDDDSRLQRIRASSFTEKDLPLSSLCKSAALYPSSEMCEEEEEEEEDVYIELPNTDVVEILETLIEVDETEDGDDLILDDPGMQFNIETEKEYEEEQQIRAQHGRERDSGVRIKVIEVMEPDSITTGDIDHDEIQLLSEADTKAMTEHIGTFETPKSEIQLLSEAEFAAIAESMGLTEQTTTEVGMVKNGDMKNIEIPIGKSHDDAFYGLEPGKAECAVHETHPETAREVESESGDVVASDDGSRAQFIMEKRIQEVVASEERETAENKAYEFKSFITAELSQETSSSSSSPVVKRLKRMEHVSEPEEGTVSSAVTQKQMKKQIDITDTDDPTSQMKGELFPPVSSPTGATITPDVEESEIITTRMSPGLTVEMSEGINTEMKVTQQFASSLINEGTLCEMDDMKLSTLEFDAENVFTYDSETVEIKECEAVTSDKSDIIFFQSVTQVNEVDEIIEAVETEKLPSFQSAVAEQYKLGNVLKEPEKFKSITSAKQVVVYEAQPESYPDLLDTAGTFESNESIPMIDSSKETDADCGVQEPQAPESEMDLTCSDDYPVTVPEVEGTDNWIKTIRAYQSLAAKYPNPDEPILGDREPLEEPYIHRDGSDKKEGHGCVLPMMKDRSSAPSKDKTKKTSVLLSDCKEVLLPVQDNETIITPDTEVNTFDVKEQYVTESIVEAFVEEPEAVRISSPTVIDDKQELPSRVDVEEEKSPHELPPLDDVSENVSCEFVEEVCTKSEVGKHLVEAETGSDSHEAESDLDVTESADISQLGKKLGSEEQTSPATCGDTGTLPARCGAGAIRKTELGLCGPHKDSCTRGIKREHTFVIEDAVPEYLKEISPKQEPVEVQAYISESGFEGSIKEAKISLHLHTKDDLHQEVKLVKTTLCEDAQGYECESSKSVDSVEYNQDPQKTVKVVREQELESIVETKPDNLSVDDSELVKLSPEMSCREVDIGKEMVEKEKVSEATSLTKKEKISLLDSVSEELKTMISCLEENLVAGTSRDIRIANILARLEQMEREVVNIGSISKVPESSIPVVVPDVQTDDVVSTSQASPSTEQQLEVHAERLDSGDTTCSKAKMPVGSGIEPSSLNLSHGPSPGGEMNGQDAQEALTDVEDIFSDGDQTPLLKRKTFLMAPQKDTGALTDTEDMDLSGDEDDIIQEKKNIPTIQELGLLPDPVKEIINLTEGYARRASPLLQSDSEPDDESVQGRHKKNIMKVGKGDELELPEDDVAEGLTDVEDMVASGDEEPSVEVEDSLPDHYMDQSEGVSDKVKLKSLSPAPKIFLTKDGDSSDDETQHKKHPRHKSKGSLKVATQEGGTTDVEDLVMSDKGETKEMIETNKSKEKVQRKKHVRRKVAPKKHASLTLTTPVGESSGLTDTEILTGDEDQEELESEDLGLTVPEVDPGTLTDSEDVEVSDTEEVADLVAKPVDKTEVSVIPDPHCEKIKISEVEEPVKEESGGETDEEGFELNENEDARPWNPRQNIVYEPIEVVVKGELDVEEAYEPALTDTEDLDIDEKEEEELISDIASRIPEEGDIYTIKEMETYNGRVTKKEMMRDVHAELMQQIKDAEMAGLTLQEAFEDNAETDVEDLEDNDQEKSKVKVKVTRGEKSKTEEGATDEESIDESDIEEEVQETPKQVRRKGRRLPLVPQVSEVRFVETEQGPLSIIITPDTFEKNAGKIIKDQVANVVFLEQEDKETTTDVEDLSDGEGSSSRNLKMPRNKQEPTTDTEDFDVDPSEVYRPHSPLPPHIKFDVLQSPKREIIHIKEDKYGVPQVTVQKLQKDELVVSDIEDLGATDTEDIEVSEEEALRLVGVTEDASSDFEIPEAGTTEVISKMTRKTQPLHVEPEEEGGTDVEELPINKKPRRKARSRSKLIPGPQGEDSHTDVEILSDSEDKGKLVVRIASPGDHTDVEDFETSGPEDLEDATREDAPTPDIIRDAAIRKMIVLKEGPDGSTYTEEAQVAPDHSNLLGVEGEPGGVTDVEDMEASGVEDEIEDHPAVDLPDYEATSVGISEKTSIPSGSNEAKHIKDNLLLPEDNFNNVTDVESLGEGEGTHEAGQLAEQQTPPLSHEQASSGQPPSGTKAGSAHGKSNLTEADLAVLESMMVAQEAEVEEMVFAQALAEMQAEAKSLKSDGDAQNVDKSLKIQKLTKSYVTAEKPIIPVKTPVVSSANVTASAAGKATDTGQHLGELTKRVADVASTMASTLESITAVAEGLEGSHLSSDEGEEQLMLMRDSPRWEDEEIQAEDTDEPRAIKAEIKLLVKTTEVGKESIEIRSIREFVECEDKNLSGFGGVVQSPTLECGQLTSMGDRVYTLQRASPDVHSPSPRFVRPQQSSTDSSYTEPTQDEFDLMAQVRDVVQPDSGAGAQQAPGSSEGRK